MPQYHFYAWTPEDERILAEIMTSPERKKVYDRFVEAAEKLHRTPKSCQNRWYEIRHKYESKAV